MIENISKANEIYEMSYTDFIGFINQWNVPPGAYKTIHEWVQFGYINKTSNILEVACTTGFSLRELSLLTQCSGLGIDISAVSIETANYNKEEYGSDLPISYELHDAREFETDIRYSHVVIGAALRFFEEPDTMITRLADNFLQDGGRILSNEFFSRSSIPDDLVVRSQQVFGITPTVVDFNEVMKPYCRLKRHYDQVHELRQETPEQLDHYCTSIVRRFSLHRSITSDEILQACYDRLLEIKTTSNELRRHQSYVTLVHQYTAREYGDRYTELF